MFVAGHKENHFKVTPEDIRKAITPKTKMLIFNSPSNPTGSVYTEEEIRAIGAVVEEAGIWVLSDEIYSKLIYDGVRHFSMAQVSEKLKERTIIVNGVSKTYAMTGWRIGWLAAPKEVAKAIDSFQSHATSNPASVSQYATLAALDGSEDELNKMREIFNDRRKFMIERIRAIDGLSCIEPDGRLLHHAGRGQAVRQALQRPQDQRLSGRGGYAARKGRRGRPGHRLRRRRVRPPLLRDLEGGTSRPGLDRIEAFVKEVF